MKKTTLSYENYINSLSEKDRIVVTKINELILTSFPIESRKIWEGKFWGGSDQTIIGYGDIYYQNKSKNDVQWFTVGMAIQKNYYSLYINTVDEGDYLVKRYANTLGKVKIGASSVSFKFVEDLNIRSLQSILSESGTIWAVRKS